LRELTDLEETNLFIIKESCLWSFRNMNQTKGPALLHSTLVPLPPEELLQFNPFITASGAKSKNEKRGCRTQINTSV